MDNESISSNSQVSITSQSGGHQPRPPDEPRPAYQRFGRSVNNSGKVVRTSHLRDRKPYTSKKVKLSLSDEQSFSGREGVRGMRHARGLEKGERGSMWATARPTYVPHPSMSTFLQSLMKTPTFRPAVGPKGSQRSHPKFRNVVSKVMHDRHLSAGNLAVATSSGDLDALQLRDELVEVKKQMNSISKERDIAKAQQIKLLKEVQRKDAQIEDLLKSGHISSRDATRSLVKTAKSNSTISAGTVSSTENGATVISLKQKIHGLEQTLRKKENDLLELKRSLEATQIGELKIQVEVYCREIDRLNQLLRSEKSKCHNGDLPANTPSSGREARIKLMALNKATVKMVSQLEGLKEENKALKLNLEKSNSQYNPALSLGPNEVGMRGSLADRYEDYNRAQMLSAIVNLEMQCTEFQKTVRILEEEKSILESLNEHKVSELRKDLAASHRELVVVQGDLKAARDNESKLKNIIRRLKEDRVHYRKTSELTQSELSDVKTTLQKKETSHVETEMELRTLQELHSNEMMALEHARKLDRKVHRHSGLKNQKNELAAMVIQRNWKRHKSLRKQKKFQKDSEDAMIDIQSVFRGHIARQQLLHSSLKTMHSRSSSESSETSEAIELIQSAMKGFLTRRSTISDIKNADGKNLRSESSQASLSSQFSPLSQVFHTPLFHTTDTITWRHSPVTEEKEELISAKHQYFSSDSDTFNGPEELLLKEEL